VLRDAAGADIAIAFLEQTLLAIGGQDVADRQQRAITAAAVEGIAEAYDGPSCPAHLTSAMVAENLRAVAARFRSGPPAKPAAEGAGHV
jgi:hypothetical protein